MELDMTQNLLILFSKLCILASTKSRILIMTVVLLKNSLGLLYWAVTNWTVHNFQSCLILLLLYRHELHYLSATTWLTTMQSCCDSKKACWSTVFAFCFCFLRQEGEKQGAMIIKVIILRDISSHQPLLLQVKFPSVKYLWVNNSLL